MCDYAGSLNETTTANNYAGAARHLPGTSGPVNHRTESALFDFEAFDPREINYRCLGFQFVRVLPF